MFPTEKEESIGDLVVSYRESISPVQESFGIINPTTQQPESLVVWVAIKPRAPKPPGSIRQRRRLMYRARKRAAVFSSSHPDDQRGGCNVLDRDSWLLFPPAQQTSITFT